MPKHWTDAEKDEIKRLWDEDDLSATKIGAMYGVSRNSIIGLMHRFGAKRRRPIGNRKNEGITTPQIIKRLYTERKKMEPKEPVTEPDASTNKLLLESSNRDCKWPVDGDFEPTICGAHTNSPPYCPYHRARAIAPSQPRRDTDGQVNWKSRI